MNLRGKVALVTGAGRGIGRAAAIELAGAGVSVGLTSRTESELAETLVLVEQAGSAGLVVPADLADGTSLDLAVAAVKSAFGPIDLLVNNGAVVTPLGPTVSVDVDEYAFAMSVNVIAPVRLAVALLPEMLDRGFGRILNVSTGAVRRADGGDPYNCYIASKSALEAHTVGLAAELAGTGVTANVLRPGIVDTEMQRYIRTSDPEKVGRRFVTSFVERFETGALIAPEVPARVVREMLESEENGAIVATADWISQSRS